MTISTVTMVCVCVHVCVCVCEREREREGRKEKGAQVHGFIKLISHDCLKIIHQLTKRQVTLCLEVLGPSLRIEVLENPGHLPPPYDHLGGEAKRPKLTRRAPTQRYH